MTAPVAPFRPPWWLRGAHAQTLWAAAVRRAPRIQFERERLELPDGDFVDLDWNSAPHGPVCVLLHGLEGGIQSRYASAMLARLARVGIRAVLLNFRGCSGTVNRLARSYHSGDTGDLQFLLGALRQRHARAPFAAIGYSLGGNVLLKYLAERGVDADLVAAAAVSVPFNLADAAARLEQGFSRLYQWRLLASLKRRVRAKRDLLRGRIDVQRAPGLETFRLFDEHVTAPLHGFQGADDYYARCSSGPLLDRVRKPTLILHALDDPFMTPAAIPRPETLSDAITLELSAHGGHVGFVAGSWPWCPEYWLESRILAHLHAHLRSV